MHSSNFFNCNLCSVALAVGWLLKNLPSANALHPNLYEDYHSWRQHCKDYVLWIPVVCTEIKESKICLTFNRQKFNCWSYSRGIMLDCQGQLASECLYKMFVLYTHIQNFHTNPVSCQAKGKTEKLPVLFLSELCFTKHGHHIFYASNSLADTQTTCFLLIFCLGNKKPPCPQTK